MANEKLLIDANALMDALKKRTSTAYPNELWGLMLAQDFVEDAPTVDAVEVPCRIGDTLYRKDGAWNVVGFECDRSGSWRVKLERWKDQFWDYHERTKVVFKSIGKTVFLTREEADAAFAKVDGDGNELIRDCKTVATAVS